MAHRLSSSDGPPEVARACARRLIVMTRIPAPGRVKTRLIPVLGPDGAAALHAALLHKTLHVASLHSRQSGADLEVRFTGGAALAADARPTECSVIWREQRGTGLGDRMNDAITAALNEGASKVIVIGTDCPDISADDLGCAWQFLDGHDLVLGPADDGGYYLIGMNEPEARLFAGIDWGTSQVLQQTLDRARRLRKSFALLPVHSDIDEAENLVVCRRLGADFQDQLPQKCTGLLSVIIPTLNEFDQLASTLTPILNCRNCEVIIADGGSTDGTVELARELGCRVLAVNRGRGRQMNAGAALARGEIFLFMHADARLPANFVEEIHDALDGGAIAGAFRFQIDQAGWSLRCVEWGTNLRVKFRQLPYGDQGLFLQSDDFFRLGGFKNWPLMEDYEMCCRLKRHGRIRITPAAIRISARRWVRFGVWRTTLINQLCVAGFRLGVSPERLARWYAACRPGSTSC